MPGARLIILGRQGAGKGTQCVRLSRHFVVPHISTGDMLRSAVRERTPLGIVAGEIMDAGGLVDDETMVGIVKERLAKPDAMSRGYILDGFPRTVGQAEALANRACSAAAVALPSTTVASATRLRARAAPANIAAKALTASSSVMAAFEQAQTVATARVPGASMSSWRSDIPQRSLQTVLKSRGSVCTSIGLSC